ncbi:hypothetical protein [Jannaschia sp. LMIT008]|uniref:hypothetical protein n=1 Tax=Jannaschia maritima TaxID=3032585 RepID=UPI0028110286|nr:hypothetical protein [Jannaschia sp. LMIT008]
MSRAVIVGLTVIVVAVLAFLAISTFQAGEELPDAQASDALGTTPDGEVVVSTDGDTPNTNVEEAAESEALTDPESPVGADLTVDTEIPAEATDAEAEPITGPSAVEEGEEPINR